MLCPSLIGRDVEAGRLHDRLGALPLHGGFVALVGEAGSGKSRLASLVLDSAADGGIATLSGRAVPGASRVPYRPLVEALLAALRGRPRPEHPDLVGFEGHLGRLVPIWLRETSVDDSPLLVAEAVVRLLGVLAELADRQEGLVLVLEDLHWADPETLDVVQYLTDALADQPVLCVATTRPTGPATGLVTHLERTQPDAVLRIGALDEAGVGQMVAACLDEPRPPAGLDAFLYTHSDGNPFLVEELLAGLVATGTLHREPAGWEVRGQLTPAVPARLADSVQSRLATLDPTARRILGAAALLGRSFAWELLPGIAEVDGPRAAAALRAGVDEQLLEPDGDGFTFRHALTREAVLADLLPDRRNLAARAWPVIERANPGLPGETWQLAADLADAAGDRGAAAARLVDGARRALDTGAFATAESAARRARDLADGDDARAIDADEVLLHVLSAAGRAGDALTLGHDLDRRLAADPAVAPTRRVNVLLAIARAAVAAGDLGTASDAIARAQAVGGGDPALLAQRDTIAAEVALDRAELGEAAMLARRAVDGARRTGQPAVECEALLILGRVLRPEGTSGAVAAFEEAVDVARRAGLPRWHLRAEQELSMHRAFGHEGPDGGRAPEGVVALQHTRDLAARYGAHITVAVMDLSLADAALGSFDAVGCAEAATACIEACRRYGLVHEPVAQLWLAGAHALDGDDAAMQAAIDAALAPDPDDPRILADLYGRVLTTRAFVRDELHELPAILDTMIGYVRRAPPTTSVYPGRVYWAILHVADDADGGLAARTEFHDTAGALGLDYYRLTGEVLEAIALGRAGRVEEATAVMAPAYEELRRAVLGHGMAQCALLLTARVAVRDGWGDPVRWLREAEAWFAEQGSGQIVRRCRTLLGEAGAPVPRRGRGDSEVPTELRALGVTSREVDVLKLVVAGRTNKEIATALYLSPKTVERHLTSLFARTGTADRHELAEVGARALPPTGPP